jgi:hypothetical protein
MLRQRKKYDRGPALITRFTDEGMIPRVFTIGIPVTLKKQDSHSKSIKPKTS